MERILAQAYQRRLHRAAKATAAGDFARALTQLAQAHIIGQQFFRPHLYCHYLMLKVGLAKRDWHQVIAQMARLLLTPFGHLTGRLPLGNSGLAQVSAFAPEPLSPAMRALFARAVAAQKTDVDS